ncbi:hypothetical protein BDU57DRAFT_508491, partial [Ampelomyces quisqualis]
MNPLDPLSPATLASYEQPQRLTLPNIYIPNPVSPHPAPHTSPLAFPISSLIHCTLTSLTNVQTTI